MNLAQRLDETNALIRSAVQPPAPAYVPQPPNPGDRPIANLEVATCLLAARNKMSTNILGEHFRDVPEQNVTRNGKDAAVACSCGAVVDLRFGQLKSCGCGRFYWLGSTAKWCPAPEPEPHTCRPEKLTTRGGDHVVSDYCHVCKADIG